MLKVDKKNFKKKELINIVSNDTGFTKNFSKKLVFDLLDIFKVNIRNEYLNLKNIGTFTISKKKERIGRNPKTKEEFLISARKVIKFTPSKNISDFFSKNYE
tara:strand:+ start:1687 stop:1992 length:306 start_codon:yes stop_codon:yes gene_type:complete